MKSTNKKFIFNKKVYIIVCTLLLIITSSILIFSDLFANKDSSNFIAYTDYYKSNQYAIGSVSQPDSTDIISMTEAAEAGSVSENVTITISSKEELKLFSTQLNANESFRSYKYKLTSNIDYYGAAEFAPVEVFSGTFDGMGYEIKNLEIKHVSSSKYVSMFAINNGTISNFGLVNPNINITSDDAYVAPICGQNNGEISYVFVRDLRNPTTDVDAGMVVNGFLIVAGLVYENKGNLHDSYASYDIIVNRETIDIINQFSEVLSINSGYISNLFFFHNSIETYIPANESTSGKIEIKYDSGTINKEFEYDVHYGTYCPSLASLNTSVTAKDSQDSWYYSGDYGSMATYLSGIITPISRGLVFDSESKTFTISSVSDYSYMYELMNLNAAFAAKGITYKIANNIDLGLIPAENYQYNYAISATIIGDTIDNSITTDKNGSKIPYPTIYNASVSKATVEGVDCYGLFPYVSGTISNINIANITINPSTTTNINAIGLAVGYLDGGKINNVNTFGELTFASNIGKFYVGHIAGLAAGGAEISNVTSSGSITNTQASSAGTAVADYMNGSAIGGILGYASSTLVSLDTCLSNTNITSGTFASNTSDIAIGGILGAGYTNVSKKLENLGEIIVTGYSSNLYVAGVIGRQLGLNNQSAFFNNEGNISITLNGQTSAMISGVVNADIITKATDYLAVSKLKLNGRYQYQGASFTNGANVNVTNSINNLVYSNVLNINSSNGFESDISGIYNLQYNKALSNLGTQEISMNNVRRFAAVVNVNSSSTQTASQKVNATQVYNLRDLKFTTSADISASTIDYTYSGCMLGEYINYINVRNEGNITFDISNAITVKTLKALGVLENISKGYDATTIFNGGDITLDINSKITANVYFSGICYSNRNGYSNADINKFNPAHNSYDSSKIGSLNNTINNGVIKVVSSKYEGITYTTTEIKSANEQSSLGNTVETTLSDTNYRIEGSLYVSGIASINESVITNTFNLGDLYAANYITSTETKYEVSAAGVSVLNIGKYAYILNSANSGNIKAINMSSGTNNSNVNAAGITCRNDLLENGTNYSSNTSDPNSKQLISFTINYGSIYSYNYRYNITSTAEEPNAKSAGILAMGLCNVINVVNYGNIYGSETASGIFGIVYFGKFQNEVTSDINIANTINYGNVYMLERGYNFIHDRGSNVSTNTGKTTPDAKCASYTTFMGFDDDSAASYAKTSIIRNTQYISVIGSIFSIINYNTSANANNVKIRYLISFNDLVSIVGFATAIPSSVNVDVSSFYSAYYSINAKTGASLLDSWMGEYVGYIPLSTSDVEMNVVKQINLDETVVTESRTFNGVFSEEFAFRKAISGDLNYIDVNNHPTDAFISDYFQFVGYKFVNDNLLDRIGWRSIAYIVAANDFAQDIECVSKVLGKVNDYSSFSANALLADSWMVYASNETLLKIVDTLIEQCNGDQLFAMLSYIFSNNSTAKSHILITSELRKNIYDKVVENSGSLDLSSLLTSLLTYSDGYSTLLAEAILGSSDEVRDFINNYINSLDQANLEIILEYYISYLESNDNKYFSLTKNEEARYNILNTLFENIENDTFYIELMSVLGITDSSSDVLKMYSVYSGLDNASKKELFINIIANNDYNKISTYLDTMSSDINYFSQLIENGYNVTSFDQIVSNADLISNSTSESSTVIDQRVELWNQIRKTETFKNYFSSLYTTTYFKATEYNNTYQSITEPHNEGAYLGETTERLGYYYTTEITPQTYFYGPLNENGQAITKITTPNGTQYSVETNSNINDYNKDCNKYISVFHYNNDSLWNSSEIMKSRGGDSSTKTYADFLHYSNILMYYDYANEQLGEANVIYTLNGITFNGFESYMLKSSKSLADPLNGVKYSTSDWTGVEFTKNNWSMTVTKTGETFSLSEGAITGIYYAGGRTLTINNKSVTLPDTRIYIKDSNGTYHPVFGQYTLTDGTNTYSFTLPGSAVEDMYKQYSFICYLAGKKYYSSTATTSTGIYRFAQPWVDQHNSIYFTWKQDNKTPVYTSQYINYTYQDILNLDGILTEYKENIVQSSDERYIINKMFNDILCKDSNIANFNKVVKKALLESLGKNATNGDKFIDNFMTSNIYSSKTINDSHPFAYLSYSSSQTVLAYLISKYTSDIDYKGQLINNVVSNKTNYIKFINAIKNGYNESIDTSYINYGYLLDAINKDSSIVDSSGNIVIDNLSGKSGSELYPILSPFDNSNDRNITLSGIIGTNITSVKSSVTINNNQYQYGIKFTELNISCEEDDAKLIIYANSSAANLSYSLTGSNSSSGSIAIEKEGIYTINLSSTTNISLTANSDIIIYDVYLQKTDILGTYTYSASPNSNKFTIPKLDTIITNIKNNNSSIADSDNLELTFKTCNITVKNNTTSKSNIYISTNKNENTRIYDTAFNLSYNGASKTITSTVKLDALLGKTIYVTYDARKFSVDGNLKITSFSSDIAYKVEGETRRIISNDDIVKQRLLSISNIDFNYETLKNNYMSSAYKLIYPDLLKQAVLNFIPMNISEDDANPNNPVIDGFSDEVKNKFLILLISNNNSALLSFINYACTDKTSLKFVYDVIASDINNYHYMVDIIEFVKTLESEIGSEKYSIIKKVLTAGYLASDYSNILTQSESNSSVSIYNTAYRELLGKLASNYQYINSNGSIDNDKFDAFLEYLEYVISTSGYGIFALSSSKGILNGEFIPDNIALDKMDANYKLSNNIFILDSTSTSSNWRGGNNGNINNTSDSQSVNYGVLVEMKQLKKSIGTTIFELNLIDENGIIHYSSESSIDLENGIITYYVPNEYFNDVSKTLTIDKNSISISNLANIYLANDYENDLRKDTTANTISLSEDLTLQNVIRVVAEETTVYKDYSIKFVGMEVAFDLIYSGVSGSAEINSDTQATVEYKNGTVVLKLTSETLPENLDLTPYIDIYQGITKKDRDLSFSLLNDENDHIIDKNHDAYITMEILSTLPAGSYTIVVNIFNEKKSVILIKNPSTECNILEFEYDGVDISGNLINDNDTYTSYIDFGRAFDYIELSNISDESFYLSRFAVSDNAKVEIVPSKKIDTDGLLVYEVKYIVTAESGDSKTYTHILKEKHPFKTYNQDGATADSFMFATTYEDGDLFATLIYDDDADNNIVCEFDRGSEPQYRVKYTLTNFYLLNNNIANLFRVDDELAPNATYNESYGGITAVVTDTCDAGSYTFIYIYENKGIWSDGEYSRKWEFPSFTIIKNYSKDATLNNITYIDGMSMLSSTSTVLSAVNVFRPINENLGTNEIDYTTYVGQDSSNMDIEAEGTKINYKNKGTDYAVKKYKDYYLVGSLSNAKLSFYAPLFKIEDHAEIYQYTTRVKLDKYGAGLQDKNGTVISDATILSNHNTTYLYVPYTSDGENVEIFLVEVDNTNKWGKVYTVESNATGTEIDTVAEDKSFIINKGTSNEKKYTLHESAGKPTNNTSLYMDYIGTPLDGHFWYVSYVVFSENALNTESNEYIKYFHLSLIDLTNNIYFDIQVNTPSGFKLDSIYITFAAEHVATQIEDVYTSKQLSAYVRKTELKTEEGENGLTIYLLDNEISILPSGYYYFYLDLPNGYKVSYEITNGKTNRNDGTSYEGAYLPPSSIVTQRISITFTIEEDTTTSDIWGVETSEVYSRMAIEIKEDEVA